MRKEHSEGERIYQEAYLPFLEVLPSFLSLPKLYLPPTYIYLGRYVVHNYSTMIQYLLYYYYSFFTSSSPWASLHELLSMNTLPIKFPYIFHTLFINSPSLSQFQPRGQQPHLDYLPWVGRQSWKVETNLRASIHGPQSVSKPTRTNIPAQASDPSSSPIPETSRALHELQLFFRFYCTFHLHAGAICTKSISPTNLLCSECSSSDEC